MTGFKICEIYLLASTKKASVIGKYKDTGGLVYNDFTKDISRGESYHFYITCDEKIDVGDWYYNGLKGIVQQCDNNLEVLNLQHFPEYAKKIIASTDDIEKQIPINYIKQLITELNQDKPVFEGLVKKVLVQYENTNIGWNLIANQSNIGDTIIPDYWKLYVNADNEINICEIICECR